jgi:hypothetical protein
MAWAERFGGEPDDHINPMQGESDQRRAREIAEEIAGPDNAVECVTRIEARACGLINSAAFRRDAKQLAEALIERKVMSADQAKALLADARRK